jgi:hypothetical protein
MENSNELKKYYETAQTSIYYQHEICLLIGG